MVAVDGEIRTQNEQMYCQDQLVCRGSRDQNPGLTLSLVFFPLHFVAEIRKYSLYISRNLLPNQALPPKGLCPFLMVRTGPGTGETRKA